MITNEGGGGRKEVGTRLLQVKCHFHENRTYFLRRILKGFNGTIVSFEFSTQNYEFSPAELV